MWNHAPGCFEFSFETKRINLKFIYFDQQLIIDGLEENGLLRQIVILLQASDKFMWRSTDIERLHL